MPDSRRKEQAIARTCVSLPSTGSDNAGCHLTRSGHRHPRRLTDPYSPQPRTR